MSRREETRASLLQQYEKHYTACAQRWVNTPKGNTAFLQILSNPSMAGTSVRKAMLTVFRKCVPRSQRLDAVLDECIGAGFFFPTSLPLDFDHYMVQDEGQPMPADVDAADAHADESELESCDEDEIPVLSWSMSHLALQRVRAIQRAAGRVPPLALHVAFTGMSDESTQHPADAASQAAPPSQAHAPSHAAQPSQAQELTLLELPTMSPLLARKDSDAGSIYSVLESHVLGQGSSTTSPQCGKRMRSPRSASCPLTPCTRPNVSAATLRPRKPVTVTLGTALQEASL